MYIIIGMAPDGCKFVTQSSQPMQTHLYTTIEGAIAAANVFRKAHPACAYYALKVLGEQQ